MEIGAAVVGLPDFDDEPFQRHTGGVVHLCRRIRESYRRNTGRTSQLDWIVVAVGRFVDGVVWPFLLGGCEIGHLNQFDYRCEGWRWFGNGLDISCRVGSGVAGAGVGSISLIHHHLYHHLQRATTATCVAVVAAIGGVAADSGCAQTVSKIVAAKTSRVTKSVFQPWTIATDCSFFMKMVIW